MYFFIKFVLADCSRNIERIIPCKAAAAEFLLSSYKLAESLCRKICKRICTDVFCYVLSRFAMVGDEVFLGVDIRSEVTGVPENR